MRVIALSADCYKFLVFGNIFQMFMNCVFTNSFSFNCRVQYYQLNLYLNFILLEVIKTEPISIPWRCLHISQLLIQSYLNVFFVHFCLHSVAFGHKKNFLHQLNPLQNLNKKYKNQQIFKTFISIIYQMRDSKYKRIHPFFIVFICTNLITIQ